MSRERPKKGNKKMRLRGIEPPHAAPEATALSTELQTHLLYNTIFFFVLQGVLLLFFLYFAMIRIWTIPWRWWNERKQKISETERG